MKISHFGATWFISIMASCSLVASPQLYSPAVQTAVPTPPAITRTPMSPVPVSSTTPTVFPSLTSSATSPPTASPPVPSPPPYSTTAIPQEVRLQLKCIDISTSASESHGSGSIVLWKQEQDMGEVLSVSDETKTLLPQGWYWYEWFVSLDGTQFAHFTDDTHQRMEFSTFGGDEERVVNWEKEWVFLRWKDNEHVTVGIKPEPREPLFSAIGVLNLITQRPQILSINPVHISISPEPEYWPLVYDPSLRYVIYPDDIASAFVLLDAKSGQKLAKIPASLMEMHEPEWSPNGAQVVVAAAADFEAPPIGFEFYSIDLVGRISKLTNLMAYYPGVYLGRYSWSPDGRYLAFWLRPGREYLATLDLETKVVTNYCIPGLDTMDGAHRPIWSPDSRQIVVESYEEGSYTRWQTVVVDIEQATATRIDENARPVFWLNAVPSVWMKRP